MAISYPLDLPGTPAEISIEGVSRVAVTASPFSGAQQVHAHQGKFWRATITTKLLDRSSAAPWTAFLFKLNGPEGTFLLGDDAADLLGSANGTPVVDGGSQTGQTLATRGWDANQTGVLLAGDYIQVDSGSSARLYQVLNDADADGNGKVTLDIWPQLRDKPTDGTSITTSNPVGVFRLAQNTSGYTWTPPSRTVITFDAVEAI